MHTNAYFIEYLTYMLALQFLSRMLRLVFALCIKFYSYANAFVLKLSRRVSSLWTVEKHLNAGSTVRRNEGHKTNYS